MPDDEAFALLDQLFAHATQAKYVYRHKWRKGDMVIWDNRSVLHQATTDYDMNEYRYLYRVLLAGEQPSPRELAWSGPVDVIPVGVAAGAKQPGATTVRRICACRRRS